MDNVVTYGVTLTTSSLRDFGALALILEARPFMLRRTVGAECSQSTSGRF